MEEKKDANQLQAKIARYKRLALLASDDQTRERIEALVGELEEQLHTSETLHAAQNLSGEISNAFFSSGSFSPAAIRSKLSACSIYSAIIFMAEWYQARPRRSMSAGGGRAGDAWPKRDPVSQCTVLGGVFV